MGAGLFSANVLPTKAIFRRIKCVVAFTGHPEPPLLEEQDEAAELEVNSPHNNNMCKRIKNQNLDWLGVGGVIFN
jgi:hypothetical protein